MNCCNGECNQEGEYLRYTCTKCEGVFHEECGSGEKLICNDCPSVEAIITGKRVVDYKLKTTVCVNHMDSIKGLFEENPSEVAYSYLLDDEARYEWGDFYDIEVKEDK